MTKTNKQKNTDVLLQKTVLILQILLGLNLIYVISKIFTSSFYRFDDIEHLRAAYFISLGDVPYRDFFEHHHPLLWYVLAPIVSLLPHSTIITLYIGRMISFGISLITGYYIYKTEKKFIGGKLCALICLNIYFWVINDTAAGGLFQVKPDIFQHCCFFIGLYYLFNYFHYQKFKHLQITALMFTLAFLFLQTSVFQCALLVVPFGYFLYHHQKKWTDLVKASIIPLLIIALCIYALWQADCLKVYYESNWQLNSVFAKIWNQTQTYLLFLIFPLSLIAATASIFWHIKNKKRNFYYLTLAFLFIGEFIRCLFISNLEPHYIWLIIYASMTAAPLICKKKALQITFLYITAYHIILGFSTLSTPLIQEPEYQLLDKEEYGTTITAGIFAKRPSYYWSHIPAETVHDIYFHPIPDYDINILNKKYPLNFVYYFPEWSPSEYKALIEIFPNHHDIIEKHFISLETLKDYQKIGPAAYLKHHP